MPAVWKRMSQPSSARRMRAAVEHVGIDDLHVEPGQRRDPAAVAHRDPHLVAALHQAGGHVGADEARRARDADLHRRRPVPGAAPATISMAHALPLTDTSPSDWRFLDQCRPVPSSVFRGIVAEPRYFGLLTALAAVFVCLAAAVACARGAPRAGRAAGQVSRGSHGRRALASAREAAGVDVGRRGRLPHRAGDGPRRLGARRPPRRSSARRPSCTPRRTTSPRATAFAPNDPGKAGPGGWAALQWNFTGPFGINIGAAWDNAIAAGNAGGGGVKVAVLDTGVAYRTSPDRRYLLAPDLDRARFVRRLRLRARQHAPLRPQRARDLRGRA